MTLVLFVAAIAILVQAYLGVKAAFLLLFLIATGWGVAVRRTVRLHPRLIAFYVLLAIAGIIWALLGLFHPANSETGITDALRIYALWSVLFVLIFTLARAEVSLPRVHQAMVVAGIGIGVVNFVGLLDMAMGWHRVPDGVLEALNLRVAIGEGTILITSRNIGPLFLILPYLLAQALRADASTEWRWATRLALLLSLATAIASGRRALWLVTLLTPAFILGLAIVTGSWARLAVRGRRLMVAGVGAGVVGLVLLTALPELPETTSLGRFQAAFSTQDERSIQKPYLLAGFAESPWIGSGFGAAAQYVRTPDAPWTYELTYFQMLFNLGVLGTALVGGVVVGYFGLVILLLRRFPEGSATPFALTVGLIAFLLGAWSNPYSGSFDLLFFVGLLPYLSTFRRGFDERAISGENFA